MSDHLDTLRQIADLREAAWPDEWEARGGGPMVAAPPYTAKIEDSFGKTFRRICISEPSPYLTREECEAICNFIAAAGMPAERWRELVAHVERLERDAARYEWLREKFYSSGIEEARRWYPAVVDLPGDTFDAAVDGAIG